MMLRNRSLRRPLRLEALEERRLLAIDMSAEEQLILENINRARANPLAEAARLGIGLNDGLSGSQTISTAYKPPLAPNTQLRNAAVGHTNSMVDNFFFDHVSPIDGKNPGQRIADAGYSANAWGENIADAWGAQHAHDILFESPGHRVNIMSTNFKEIGVGAREREEFGWWYTMLTEKFARRAGNSFITGVVFDDNLIGDNFYTIGEGLAGVTISAQRTGGGAPLVTTTGTSGGYSIQAPAGTYVVTASGGGWPVPYQQTITIGSENVKLDYTLQYVPPPPDVLEPNDTFATATAINLTSGGDGFACSSTIHATNNDDFYRFTATRTALTLIEPHDERASGYLGFELYNSSQQSLGVSDIGGRHFNLVAGQTYYVRVFGYEAGHHRDYDLEINNPNIAFGTADAYEPNNTGATATQLPAGEQSLTNLNLRDYNDLDIFAWTPSASGPVTLYLDGAASGRWQFGVWTSAALEGAPLLHASTVAGEASVTLNAVAGTTYYMAVNHYGCASFFDTYDFSIALPDPPVATGESALAFTGQSRAIDVLANDTADTSWPTNAVQIVTPPVHGGTSVNPATGVVTYTPAPGYAGFDSFRYTVRDGLGMVSAPVEVKLTVVNLANLPWQNVVNRFDVDADGTVAPLDALLLINRLNATGGGTLAPPTQESFLGIFWDVSGDNTLTPVDAVEVVNRLNAGGGGEGEPYFTDSNPIAANVTDGRGDDPLLLALAWAWWEDDD